MQEAESHKSRKKAEKKHDADGEAKKTIDTAQISF